MPTLNAAQTATVSLTVPNAYLTVDCSSGAVVDVSWVSAGSISGKRTVQNISEDVGPFTDQTTVTLYCRSGTASYSTTGDQASQAALQALVSDAEKPFDALVPPLQQATITGAISTTAALTATATGTYRKARIAWNNNGASGTAKLRIAANTDNDVHGLVAAQSAKRRDYEMTMGDSVTLVCAEPITRLTFSADGAITSATHSIQVTFGS